jgi:hypothetical protein
VAPGELQKQWRQNGRNYFHYVQTSPGLYIPVGMISAKFMAFHDTVQLDHMVNIDILYDPRHSQISKGLPMLIRTGCIILIQFTVHILLKIFGWPKLPFMVHGKRL